MTRHTTTQEFGPYGANASDAMVKVKANGGSLTIQQIIVNPDDPNNPDIVPVENGVISADSSFALQVSNGLFRATVAGACVYEWIA